MDLKEIEKNITLIVPSTVGVTDITPEGVDIVISVKNIREFYNSDQLIKRIASTIRKRVIVRSDPSQLADPDITTKAITEIVPVDAGVDKVRFRPEFCEVWIEALKPGLVIGKNGVTMREIMVRTGWQPKILRTPTMASSVLAGIRSTLIKESPERKKFLSGIGKKICSNGGSVEWARITCLGAFQEVGRSCMLLETSKSKVLIDCGINAATTDPAKAYPYLSSTNMALDQIDAVILTHAHLDHCGFVPFIYAYGYDGPIYCTPPTRDLSVLLQMDYLGVTKKSENPPYKIKDVHKQLSNCITLNYEEVADISPDIKLTFYNAGHILGSAAVHLHIDEGLHNLVITGDLKYGYTRLFNQANTNFPRAETLFIESTYGGKNDFGINRRDADERLISIIRHTTLEKKGKVLIPVFSVGRAQEIMLVLEEYSKRFPDWNIPVYLDGMILEASAIHTAYPEYLRHNIQKRILSNDSPFEKEIFEPVKKPRKEVVEGEPAVILAPSGMLTGGPSVDYLRQMAEDERNTLIFVGYQSVLSFGRRIQKGLKEIPTEDENGKLKTMQINMRVETVEGYSGHSDRIQLLNYIRAISPTPHKVFTMHGDENNCLELARTVNNSLRIEARAPMALETIRLR